MIDRGVASRLPSILLERSASCYYRMNLSLTVRDSVKFGGAEGIRTPDLINAIDALSQLSYSPTVMGRTMQLVPFQTQFPPDLRDPISSHRRVRFNSNPPALPTSYPHRRVSRGEDAVHPLSLDGRGLG